MSARRPTAAPIAALLAVAILLGALPGFAVAAPRSDLSRPMIVLLGRDADVDAAVTRGRHRGVEADLVFRHTARGYAAKLTPAQIAALRSDPSVDAVVEDSVVELAAPQVTPTGVRRVGALDSPTARIDGTDERVNVDVAIIDTGIQKSHPDLNVVDGKNCVPDEAASAWGTDDNGHGTHVAGTVGALDNGVGVVGVAPGARLWAVKVFQASGFSRISWVTCGIDWVAAQKHPDGRQVIEVANMSLRDEGRDDRDCGYTNADVEHRSICRAVGRGITFVAAAGNDANNAGNWRPGSYDEVITVSALADFDGLPGGLKASTCSSFGQKDTDDTFADFSNHGSDVDLIAPGKCILSTLPGGYGVISGTSMATPAVAGAAALYLATHPGTSPADVRAALRAAGSDAWATGSDRDASHEPLLDASSFGAGPGATIKAKTGVRMWVGGRASTTVALVRRDGLKGTVELTVDGLPEGVTASFAKPSFLGWDVAPTTLTFTAAPEAAPGTTQVEIVATAGSGTGLDRVPMELEVGADTVAPVAGGISEALLVPSTVSPDGAMVRTRWTTTDEGSGIDTIDLRQRRSEGPWSLVASGGPTFVERSARLPFKVAVGHRINVTDAAGNPSETAYGPDITLTQFYEGTGFATYGGTWKQAKLASALGGATKYATAAGASVVMRFTGRSVGWISTVAPSRGSAKVYIDGVYQRTVVLTGTTATRRMVFAATVEPGAHTLKVVVVGTSGRPRVDVDGFVVLSQGTVHSAP
jgi:subtilisin